MLDIALYILIVLAIGLNVFVVKSFGKGLLNVVFPSFGFSMLFFGIYYVFLRMTEAGIGYSLSDVTMHVWAHAIMYLSIASVIWGGYRIKTAVESGSTDLVQGWSSKDTAFYGLLTVLAITILLVAQPLESTFSSVVTGSFIDTLGLHHVTVFLLGGIAVWYLLYIKGNWGLLSASISLVIVFMALIGIQHLWETVTESWKWIELSSDVIEGVEAMILLPALIVFCVAQWKIIKFIKG